MNQTLYKTYASRFVYTPIDNTTKQLSIDELFRNLNHTEINKTPYKNYATRFVYTPIDNTTEQLSIDELFKSLNKTPGTIEKIRL